MMETFPYLLNINEDPQLSGVLKHFIQDGILFNLFHFLVLSMAQTYNAQMNTTFYTLIFNITEVLLCFILALKYWVAQSHLL